MKFSVAEQDGRYYIVAIMKSDDGLGFLKEPTMLIKNFDGEVVKLYGDNIGTSSELSRKGLGSMAQFVITPEQFEMLKGGVSKVRFSTAPIEHERTFRRDKIGKKLYRLYMKRANKDENF